MAQHVFPVAHFSFSSHQVLGTLMPGLIVYLPSLLKAGTEIFITAHGGTELSPDSGDGCGSAPFKFPSFHIVAQIMPYQLHSRLNMHCLSVRLNFIYPLG